MKSNYTFIFLFSLMVISLIPFDSLIPKAYALSATGGTITYSGGYTIHTFTTSGTFTVTGSGDVEYLVIAGGGGSGSYGGGGGAGGYRNATGFAVTTQAYTVTIGAGGTAGGTSNGGDGGNSVFSTITSTGGGGGGSNDNGQPNGRAGGSGGGAGNGGAGGTGGAGTGGQGNNGGGASFLGANFATGGGGGAGAVGANQVSNSVAGNGGAGTSSYITGASVCRAGGGGGTTQTTGTDGTATCGGGAGLKTGIGVAGTANTGGGGGGSGGSNTGAVGGSGIVIIKYLPSSPPPYAVTTLTNPSETSTTESLSWSAPYAGGGGQTIIGYQINKTTPWGLPLVLVNDTGTTTTTYTAVGLTPGTNYSFRVSAWTNVTAGHPLNNATGNILNVITPLNSYGTVAPANLNAIPVICDPTLVNLEWTSGAMQNINGYRIQRETPVGGGFSSLVGGNTTNTLLYYNDTGRVANNNYNYRVYSLNQSGISAASNVDSTYTCHKPNAVTTLTGTATDLQTIILTWVAPVPYAPLLGYMVNFTTPEGNPITISDANTGNAALTDTVYGLSIGLNYSFRVSPVTMFGSNSSGNIFNATTTTAFELGDLDLTDTVNTDDFKIFYNRANTNTTSILLDVTYPSSYTLTCNMLHKFSRDNNTYTGLTETPISGPGADVDNVVSSFVFNGANTEVILVNCYDTSIPDAAKYIITVTDFALLDQIDNFRNGTYGTRGQIGGLDMIALIVVIIGMIGFNRVTPIAGVVFMAATTFTLAHFEIIEWYEIMYPALALVILLAWVRTRQSD